MGLDLGGFANAYRGFQKGQDDEMARQQLEKDREFLRQQRQEVTDQYARDKALREGVSNIAQTKETDSVDSWDVKPIDPDGNDGAGVTNDATATVSGTSRTQKDAASSLQSKASKIINPVSKTVDESKLSADTISSGAGATNDPNSTAMKGSIDSSGKYVPGAAYTPPEANLKNIPDARPKRVTVNRTEDEKAMDLAALYQKAGRPEEALKYIDYANRIAFQRSTRLMDQVEANAEGKSLYNVAKEVGTVFHDDPFFGGIKNITPNADGSVSITAFNKQTGSESTKTYTDASQLLNSARAYYTPETYQAMRQAAAAAKYKVMEEQAKPVIVPMGGSVVQNGKIVTTNETGLVQATDKNGEPMFDSAGKPVMVRGGSGGKAASSAEKSRQFDQKEVDKFMEPPKHLTFETDSMSGKESYVPALHSAYVETYSQLLSDSQSPAQASAQAIITVGKLRDAAQDRVAKSQSTKTPLTLSQATSQILAEARKFQPPQPAASAAPKASTASSPADTEQALIYRSEIAKARQTLSSAKQGSPEYIRAQNDIASLQREMKRAGIADQEPQASPGKEVVSQPSSSPVAAKKYQYTPFISGPRINYLTSLNQSKKISPEELNELNQLEAQRAEFDKVPRWGGLFQRPPADADYTGQAN